MNLRTFAPTSLPQLVANIFTVRAKEPVPAEKKGQLRKALTSFKFTTNLALSDCFHMI